MFAELLKVAGKYLYFALHSSGCWDYLYFSLHSQDAGIMPLLRDVVLPFIEPIPQPASVILSHQTSFASKLNRRGNKPLFPIYSATYILGPECTISGNPEMFWLCTSTGI